MEKQSKNNNNEKDGNQKKILELNHNEYRRLRARLNTYLYLHDGQERGVCPKCGKYIIIDGYVCFGCGYDNSVDRRKRVSEN